MEKKFPTGLIADRYQVKDIIGSGGMGVVMRAYDSALDIDVAIKMIWADHAEQGAVRFQREAIAAGKLNHPNITRVMNFGQTPDGSPYMVMELLNGISLSQLLAKEKLSAAKAIPIFMQIASGLAYAHRIGVVHRDLKPSNIILLEQGIDEYLVKIVDFGVAKIIDEKFDVTQVGGLVGSPLYMSPEQALQAPADARMDIYSLGCLMFETLTGQPPFKGQTALETLSMHRNTAAPLVTDIVSIVRMPAELVNLVDKCLHKMPENRPANADEVIERLIAIHDKLDNKTLTKAQIQRISNQHFRIKLFEFWKSKMAAIAGVTIVLFLIALGVNMFQSEQKRIYETKSLTKSSNPSQLEFSVPELKQETLPGSFEFTPIKNGVIAEIGKSISDKDLGQLKGKFVTVLKLDQSNIDGSGLALVNKPALLELSLRDTKVTDKNLKNLVGMNNLKILIIGSDSVSDEGLKYIGSLKSLINLSLKSNKITKKGVKHLRNLTNLESINIDSNALTDDSLDSLSDCPILRYVYLNGSSMSPDVGVNLAALKNLTLLDVSNLYGLSHKSFDALMSLEHLSNLTLDCGVLDEGSFIRLAKSKKLTTLNFTKTKFNPRWLSHLQKMPGYELICFNDSDSISDGLIEQLLHLKKIQSLFFTGSNITDKQFLRLTHIKSLECVYLNHCSNVSDAAVEAFTETFRQLWKKDCKVSRSNASMGQSELVK